MGQRAPLFGALELRVLPRGWPGLRVHGLGLGYTSCHVASLGCETMGVVWATSPSGPCVPSHNKSRHEMLSQNGSPIKASEIRVG